MEDLEEVFQHQKGWMREMEEEEQRYWAARHTTTGTSNQHNNDASTWSTPPPHEHHMHDVYIMLSEPHVKLNNDATHMELENGAIKSLKCNHDALGLAEEDWTAEMEKESESGFTKVCTYQLTTPSITNSPNPSTTTPTSKYTPPRTHYTCPPTQYVPSHSHFILCYPPFCLPHAQWPLVKTKLVT
jgi:hypothetical protein